MKKIFLFLFLVVFSLNLVGCESFSWRKYKNKEYRFSMLVPKAWDLDEDVQDGVLALYVPEVEVENPFVSNIRVVVEDLPAPIDLSTYYDINREEFRQVFKRMGDISEGQGMQGINRYQWLAFTSPLTDKVFIRVVSAVWMKGKRVYILTCVMDLRRAAEIEPAFRKMIASFSI
jgi:hypothetical protein